MKRLIAVALAALLCIGLAACGKTGPAPSPTKAVTEAAPAPVAEGVFNNGGRYVQYNGDVYYWQYWPACIESTAMWGEFPEAPGIRRPMMRLDANGEARSLFLENGCGSIWIYKDSFYLTWLDDGYTPQIFTAAMDTGDATGDAKGRRELGAGEIFALDETRGLLLATVSMIKDHHVAYGICVIDTETGEREELPVANVEPLLYDEASASLYYWDFSLYQDSSFLETRAAKLCAVDVTTGDTRDVAWLDTGGLAPFEDADAVEFDNVWLEGDSLHVFLSGYSGNAHMLMGSAHLVVDMRGDGVAQYDAGDAPDYSRYPVNEPFDMRDVQGYDEFYGYYVRGEAGELLHVLTQEDMRGLGLPEGPFYEEEAFADVRHVEYVDGALFFSIARGPRNEAEDIGWRYAYDFESMHVYRKDIAAGRIEELYFFDKSDMRG